MNTFNYHIYSKIDKDSKQYIDILNFSRVYFRISILAYNKKPSRSLMMGTTNLSFLKIRVFLQKKETIARVLYAKVLLYFVRVVDLHKVHFGEVCLVRLLMP